MKDSNFLIILKLNANHPNIKKNMSLPITSSAVAIDVVLASFDTELNAQLGAMESEVRKLDWHDEWLRAQLMKRPTKGKCFLFVSRDVFD